MSVLTTWNFFRIKAKSAGFGLQRFLLLSMTSSAQNRSLCSGAERPIGFKRGQSRSLKVQETIKFTFYLLLVKLASAVRDTGKTLTKTKTGYCLTLIEAHCIMFLNIDRKTSFSQGLSNFQAQKLANSHRITPSNKGNQEKTKECLQNCFAKHVKFKTSQKNLEACQF